MSEEEAKAEGQKQKISKLAIASIVTSSYALYIWPLRALSGHLWLWLAKQLPGYYLSSFILFMLALPCMLALCGVILGIMALIWIKKSKGHLIGKPVAIVGLVIGWAAFLFDVMLSGILLLVKLLSF